MSIPTAKLLSKDKRVSGAELAPLTEEWVGAVTTALDPREIQVRAQNNQLMFWIDRNALIEATLRDPESWRSLIPQHATAETGSRKVLIEFSSPNIAKPFHAGHLRSTIIGGFLSRLYSAHGHSVHRVNYLGDWGKQFGLLGVGYQRFGDRDALAADPIRHLFEVYVATNAEVENDRTLDDKARQFFAALEAGSQEETALWQQFRSLSVDSYQNTYARLGIEFDEVAGESMYSRGASAAVDDISGEQWVETEENNALVADLTAQGLGKVLLRKADGATLYITRDIAAARDRYNRHSFDEMLYIAGSPQTLHFRQLFELMRLSGFDWGAACRHVSFGSVQGMSTRRGNVVLLQDILDDARDRMASIAQANPAKLHSDIDIVSTAEAVGLAAVVVQDLKSRRVKNYTFDWERILKPEGDTGPFLMYTHARLCSIARTSGIGVDRMCDLTLLTEPEALGLVDAISR